MAKFEDAVTVYTNFITPPDFIDEEKHTVLLVDVSRNDVDALAAWCQTAKTDFNVYIYDCNMEVTEWFGQVAKLADAIVVNTQITSLTAIKDRLAEMPKAWYYGPKNFLANNHSIKNPIDYFIEYEKSVK